MEMSLSKLRGWCRIGKPGMQNGEYIRPTSDFYSSMDKAGFVKRKTNKGMVVYGLSLKEGQDFLS